VLVLTWLDRADRDVLHVHPRDDLKQPQRGVFSTRSADRPNPMAFIASRLCHRLIPSAFRCSRLRRSTKPQSSISNRS
jgi:tRNA (Thr-GGU) A37 N-methylase